MSYPSDSSPTSNAIQRVAFALRTTGWFCFWTQLVLAVVSAIIQLFAIAVFGPAAGKPGILGFSIFQAFRYTRLSRRLKAPGMSRPSRAETMKQVRLGLTSNLSGMAVTLVASEAINGILLAKAISQPRGFLATSVNLQDFIQPVDFFVVLANTHTIVAHFVGIVGALWLMREIYKN
jgi:hypothetical protein